MRVCFAPDNEHLVVTQKHQQSATRWLPRSTVVVEPRSGKIVGETFTYGSSPASTRRAVNLPFVVGPKFAVWHDTAYELDADGKLREKSAPRIYPTRGIFQPNTNRYVQNSNIVDLLAGKSLTLQYGKPLAFSDAGTHMIAGRVEDDASPSERGVVVYSKDQPEKWRICPVTLTRLLPRHDYSKANVLWLPGATMFFFIDSDRRVHSW